MEIYEGRLIAYSLGNFSSWNTFSLKGPLAVSTILEVQLAPNGVALSAKLNPVFIQDPGRPQSDPRGRAIKIIRQLSREDLGSPLFDKHGVWKRQTIQAAAATGIRVPTASSP